LLGRALSPGHFSELLSPRSVPGDPPNDHKSHAAQTKQNNKETSAQYGSLYDSFVFDMKGVSKRSAFVLDRAGIVQYAEVLDNAGEIPSFEAIQSTLASLSL